MLASGIDLAGRLSVGADSISESPGFGSLLAFEFLALFTEKSRKLSLWRSKRFTFFASLLALSVSLAVENAKLENW
jgi:hypothetical protein